MRWAVLSSLIFIVPRACSLDADGTGGWHDPLMRGKPASQFNWTLASGFRFHRAAAVDHSNAKCSIPIRPLRSLGSGIVSIGINNSNWCLEKHLVSIEEVMRWT
jgi:hypothetical protein